MYTLLAYGAYGREPTLSDWKAGKDFSMEGMGGPYFSIRDSADLKRDAQDTICIVFYTKAHKVAFTWTL